jgi:hypothetical protein
MQETGGRDDLAANLDGSRRATGGVFRVGQWSLGFADDRRALQVKARGLFAIECAPATR